MYHEETYLSNCISAFSSSAHATPLDAIHASGIINNAWSLMTVDRSSGTASQIGALGGSGITADGLAIVPVTVTEPEPATIALPGIGIAGLAGGAARRKWKKKAVANS